MTVGSAATQISLVICTRNRADQLATCLERVAEMERNTRWDLVVCDNGSTDDTRRVVERFAATFDGPLTYAVEPRIGTSHAHNTGIANARGELIAFTDDDCYVEPNYLRDVLACFDAQPQLGFLGGRVLLFDPTDYPITIQESTERVDIPPRSFIPAGLIHGANFAFRRRVLEAIEGFDGRLGAGTNYPCEDIDVLMRASAAGWHGAYDPRPTVAHHHKRKTEAQARALMSRYDHGRGAYYVKALMQPAMRRLYLKRWYWNIRYQPRAQTYRELSAAARFLVTAALHPP